MTKLAIGLFLPVLVVGVRIWAYVLANPIAPIPIAPPQPFPFDRRWILLGGPAHDTFVGALSLGWGRENLAVESSIGYKTSPGGSDDDSIFAWTVGLGYGSPTNPNSIANHNSPYGTPHGPYSACDPAAARPPILANESGQVAGNLTLNAALPGRLQDPWIIEQLEHLCR
jgi:hypothetical protein